VKKGFFDKKLLDVGSISSAIYEQLLPVQIPKAKHQHFRISIMRTLFTHMATQQLSNIEKIWQKEHQFWLEI